MEDKKIWINKLGNEVHEGMVMVSEKIKTEMIETIIGEVEQKSKELAVFKKEKMEELLAYQDLMRMEYGLEEKKSIKGNKSFISFDGLQKIDIATQETMQFNSDIELAKEKIDLYLKEETKDSSDDIKTLVLNAFEVDKKGHNNTRQILTLKQYPIENKLWKEAMEIISKSLEVVSSKQYIRFHKKDFYGDKFKQISLDFSKL